LEPGFTFAPLLLLTMPRTVLKNCSSFTREGSVTYSLPSPPFSSAVVTITLPPRSTWTSGLHWHETHTEYLEVVRGTALVTLNGITKSFSSEDGIIIVPRLARHEWRRANADGEELVVKEWTDPVDGEKEIFFRNLSSVIVDCTKTGPPVEWWLTWQLFVVFWGLDNYPVILDLSWVPLIGLRLEWALTHIILLAAVLAGKIGGLKSVYEEYTPSKSLAGPAKGGSAGKKEE
jgi:quercetin dioxygenase-like cupin family protein